MENEQQIKENTLTVVEASKAIQIHTEQDYTAAADFLKQVKQSSNSVKNFFKDIKDQAAKAHKAICEKEKSYLNPLNEAERRVKGLMSDYTMDQERIRREKEAELRRKQEEAACKALEEAERLEASGDKESAEATLDMAAQIEELKPTVEIARPKVQGISYQSDYDVSVFNDALVPVNIMGVCLRPVDLPAVKRLAKAAKGNIKIPGVQITETKIAKVRA